MNNLQYDSFYKFLVSLGVVLIALPLGFLFYLLNIDQLLISKSEYENLSSLSLHSLEQHHNLLSAITSVSPFILIPLIVIGIALIIIGGRKWYGLQKELDKQLKADTFLKTNAITELNSTESTEKAIKEVFAESESAAEVTPNDIVEYMKVEDKCFKYYLPKLSKRYHLKQNLQIDNAIYDMVAISKQNYTDLIFEIKHWIISPSPDRLYKLADHIKYIGEKYKSTTDHEIEYVIIVVTPKSQLKNIEKKVNSFFMNYDWQILENINFEFYAEEYLPTK